MNAEEQMNGSDGLGVGLRPPEGCTGAVVYDSVGRPSIQHDAGTCPVHESAGSRGQKVLRDLAQQVGYPDENGNIEVLIGYKEALENCLLAALDSKPVLPLIVQGQVVELSEGAYRALCGLVHESDDVDVDKVEAPTAAWRELRELFPLKDASLIEDPEETADEEGEG